MAEIKAFNRWSVDGIKVEDPGLVRYINLNPVIVPRSGGRNIGTKFHKSRTFIVERLMNKLMIPGHKGKKHFKSSGHCTGKGSTSYKLMEEVLQIIEKSTKKNPIEVLVKAVENGAPREEIIMIEYGGARYPKPVECSPQRRVDISLKLLVQGSYHKCFNTRKSIVDTLSAEIIAAYNKSSNALIISKKNELERQADSSR